MVAVVSDRELRDGPNARTGVGQAAEYRAIPEPDDVGDVDGRKELAGLLDGQLRSLALRYGVLGAVTVAKGFIITAWRCTNAPKNFRRAVSA